MNEGADLFRCLESWVNCVPMFILVLSGYFIKLCLSGRKNGAAFYTCSAKSTVESNIKINRHSGVTAWLFVVTL